MLELQVIHIEALPVPASGDLADASKMVLQPHSSVETTVDGGSGKRMTVTLAEPAGGKRTFSAWCWQFINGKNVVCLVTVSKRLPATTT